jgi:hypothetical protein
MDENELLCFRFLFLRRLGSFRLHLEEGAVQ